MKTNSVNIATQHQKKEYHFLSSLQWSKEGAILIMFLLMTVITFADKDKDRTPGDKSQQSNLDWKLDATIKGVQFYYAISGCNGRQVAFLKFVNKNSYTVNVSWKESVQTQLRTEENLFRGGQRMSLPPGETFADNCSATCQACVLTSNDIDPTYIAQVKSFSFKNISVEK